ncbi:protein of unknown function [Paraburkholderia kururiensis]
MNNDFCGRGLIYIKWVFRGLTLASAYR